MKYFKKSLIKGWKYPTILGVFFLFTFTPGHFLNPSMPIYDDSGYISHAFTLGIDFDLDYSNELSGIANTLNRDKTIAETGIGTGILTAPFISIFSIIDRILKNPVINDRTKYVYSWSFFGFLLAANAYFLLGSLILWICLKREYANYKLDMHLLLCLSTGIIYYVIGRFTMSHAFEYFMLCATIFFSYKINCPENGKLKTILYIFLACSFSVGNIWVRFNNVNAVLIPIIIILYKSKYDKKITWVKISLVLFCLLLAFVPFCLFSYKYYHGAFPTRETAYAGGAIDARPGDSLKSLTIPFMLKRMYFIIPIFFGSEFGLIFSNPLLLAGGSFLLFLAIKSYRKAGILLTIVRGVLLISFFGLNMAIVIYWGSPASDYGFRYLFGVTPLAFIGICELLEKIEDNKWKRVLTFSIIVFSIFSSLLVLFYRTIPELAPHKQINIFGIMNGSSNNGYVTNFIRAIINLKNWILFIGKSLLGLFFSKWGLKSPLMAFVPEEYIIKMIPRYMSIPIVVYYQSALIWVFWILFGLIFGSYANYPLNLRERRKKIA